MHRPSLFIVCAALLLSAPARADSIVPPPAPLPDYLSLDDALKLFRQRGLDLLIAEAQVYSAEGDLKTAGAIPNPNWSAGYYRVFYSGGVFSSPDGFFVGLGDSNAIEDSLSGKRYLRLKVARAALQAAKMTRADAQRTLEFTLKQQYIQAVLARDALDFALEVQKSSTLTFEKVQLRYEKGAISEADEAKIETAKLEADQAVDAASQALRVAKVGLAYLLGVRAVVPDYRVEQDLPHFVISPRLQAASREGLLDEALGHRPDLRALQFQRDRAGAAVALARRLRFPDLALNFQFSQQGTTSFCTDNAGKAMLTPVNAGCPTPGVGNLVTPASPPTFPVGLSGTLPLFYLQAGEIRKAEADYRTQDLSLAKQHAQVVADVETAFANFDTTRKLVQRMEARLLERSKRARDLVAVQYDKGAVSLLELLDAQRQYIATNVEYLQDLANYWTAVFQLEQAVGMDLR
jgi:cobalt-zinc-cadmium efflux system outer membrane protein